jgi:FlaG/FlaF family flagellin (archaellin)
MANILMVLLGINMAAVLGVLLTGMVGVARGNTPQRSNQLMRWRVMLQASAIFLFVLLMIFR